MPNKAYVNSFQPNTAIGQGLQNITAAFFGAQQSQREADITAQELAMKQNYYGANAEQSRALAQKALVEKAIQDDILRNRGFIKDPRLLAADGSIDQLAKATQQYAETDQYNNAAQNPSAIPNFGKLQAALGGKALYDNGLNNTTFGLFDGQVQNEGNALNQAEIEKVLAQKLYGNDGSEVGKSVINLNKAKMGTESAQAAKYKADTDKVKQEKTQGKMVLSLDSINPDGTENYKYVPQEVGGVVKKNGTKAKDVKITTADEANKTLQLAQSLFGVDQQSAIQLVSEASAEMRNTGDTTGALNNAFKRLSGGQELVDNEDGGWFGTSTKSLPKQPPKTAQPKPKVTRPEGQDDTQLIKDANAAIAAGADAEVVKKRLMDMGVGI